MNELEVKVSQQLGVIDCNLEEIKEALRLQMTAYTELEVTEDNIGESKSDLATLRKIKKAVDDRRKEVKKSFMKPYEDFEADVKSVLSIIDEPINMIDGKLKGFEEKRVAEKVEHAKEIYAQNIGEYADFLPFSAVFRKTWGNKTCADNEIVSDIQEAVLKVSNDMAVIKGLRSEIEEQVIDVYKKSCNNLSAAVQKNTDYMEAKEAAKKALEAEKKEAEKKIEVEEKNETKVETEAYTEPEEMKPLSESEVTFTVSAADATKVEFFLEFNEIFFKEEWH